MIKLKFFGLGGQGVVTAAKTLSEAFPSMKRVCDNCSAYGRERRGVSSSIPAL